MTQLEFSQEYIQLKTEKNIEMAGKKKKHKIVLADGEKPVMEFKIEETFYNQETNSEHHT